MFWFKIVYVTCLVVACSAQYGEHGGGILLSLGHGGLQGLNYDLGHNLGYQQAVLIAAPENYGHGQHVDYYTHPKFEFKYGVSDENTKDQHSQNAVQNRESVQGQYSIIATYGHRQDQNTDYYTHPKYEFKHGVSDEHTKDQHSQLEVSSGKSVQSEYSVPANYDQGQDQHIDYYAHPKYEFKYGISDENTKDRHSQHEFRDGDSVQGEYSLHESDGTVRTVKYTADKNNGFNAEVIRSGHAAHPETHITPACAVSGEHDQEHNNQQL
ncbi:hypothetical protein FQR65_LT13693 [Abscondita terminalis]|nr:hypothetical protein FQR65_LT13693 [Abscondita terminalis]